MTHITHTLQEVLEQFEPYLKQYAQQPEFQEYYFHTLNMINTIIEKDIVNNPEWFKEYEQKYYDTWQPCLDSNYNLHNLRKKIKQ